MERPESAAKKVGDVRSATADKFAVAYQSECRPGGRTERSKHFRRAKQAYYEDVNAVRHSHAQVQPAQDATYGLRMLLQRSRPISTVAGPTGRQRVTFAPLGQEPVATHIWQASTSDQTCR